MGNSVSAIALTRGNDCFLRLWQLLSLAHRMVLAVWSWPWRYSSFVIMLIIVKRSLQVATDLISSNFRILLAQLVPVFITKYLAKVSMERTFALAQFWYWKRFFLLRFFLSLTCSNPPLNSSSQDISSDPFLLGSFWHEASLLVEGGGPFPHYDISLVFSLLYLQRSPKHNWYAIFSQYLKTFDRIMESRLQCFVLQALHIILT